MAGGSTRLSNKINASGSTNPLIWTALIFSRPFGTGIDTSGGPVCFQQALADSADRKNLIGAFSSWSAVVEPRRQGLKPDLA
jgi:hypothetical protein